MWAAAAQCICIPNYWFDLNGVNENIMHIRLTQKEVSKYKSGKAAKNFTSISSARFTVCCEQSEVIYGWLLFHNPKWSLRKPINYFWLRFSESAAQNTGKAINFACCSHHIGFPIFVVAHSYPLTPLFCETYRQRHLVYAKKIYQDFFNVHCSMRTGQHRLNLPEVGLMCVQSFIKYRMERAIHTKFLPICFTETCLNKLVARISSTKIRKTNYVIKDM